MADQNNDINKQKFDEVLSTLSEDQREEARGLKTPEEMLEFAQEVGVVLTPEQLDQISGGGWWPCGGYK
ncbi:MAG: hypothetical protein IKE43_00595 [Coriobacteriales bacterium]|nr:hypothetical protein [Coriobacteriales bacterium]